jgi:hypothetical protein
LIEYECPVRLARRDPIWRGCDPPFGLVDGNYFADGHASLMKRQLGIASRTREFHSITQKTGIAQNIDFISWFDLV